MADTVSCPKCENINPAGQATCLACKADLSPPAALASPGKKPSALVEGIVTLAVIILPVVLVVKVMSWWSSEPEPKPRTTQTRPLSQSMALLHCQRAIKSVATNPSAARIPAVGVDESGAQFRYVWRHGGGLRLQNGFGALMDASATCVISKSTRKITELTIDGRRLR